MENTVSIIVPIYNVEDYLERCIGSIIGQTYEHLQIILVDDGSTDNSSVICDNYKEKDSRIIVIHKPNGGLVSARKAGLKIAVGEYVGYVDGDDWIEPDYYEQMLNYMIKNDVDMVETEHYIDAVTESKRIKSKLPSGKYDAESLIPVMLCDDNFNECKMQPYLWSKLFKKSLLEKHQMRVDENIKCGEDIAVVYAYILEAGSIYIADYAGYHYMQRIDSMTGVQNIGEYERDRALIKYLKTIFETGGQYSKIMLKQLNQYTKSMLLLRQISFFDRDSGNSKLMPFGGLKNNMEIAVYGAGRMGKSVYQYITSMNGGKNVIWGDKEYSFYQQLGMPVISPEDIILRQKEYDVLVIAVSSKNTAQGILNSLFKAGLQEDKAVWLTDEFVSDEYEVLSDYLA